MAELWNRLSTRLAQGDNVVLATILQSHGSTPRGIGANMLVFPDGSCYGTIGGGAVEYQVQQLALSTALPEQRSIRKEYTLSNRQAANIGMVCGGNVQVYLQYLSANNTETLAFFQNMSAASQENRSVRWLLSIDTQTEQGQNILCEKNNDLDLPSEVSSLLRRPVPGSVLVNDVFYYVQPISESGSVYLFGGGHISQKVVPVLHSVFFRCVVIDPRAEFVTEALFPNASRRIAQPFQGICNTLSISEDDAIVIVTRGHVDDRTVLIEALQTPAYYIGMIGSRNKINTTYTTLIRENSVPYGALQRVHAPIGLPIGGETPEEIAISIAAELIAARSQRNSTIAP